ncbi:MAG: hypothetical protein ACKVU4_03730 [Phycisphaerales bacterium]
MGVVPDTRLQQLEFYEAHLPVWQDNAGAIGLTVAQLTALSTLITAARTSYDAQQPTRNAAKAATLAFYDDITAAHENGSNLIATIKTYASSTNNPGVYSTAQIPPPAAPTPAPPPVAPTDLVSVLNTDGSITLKWKGSLAQGAFFSVWRAVAPGTGGQFSTAVQIASLAEKSYLDTGVPAAVQAQYTLRTHRGGQVSTPSEPTIVKIGQPTDGAEAMALKIAA